jgi:hypothetical protein
MDWKGLLRAIINPRDYIKRRCLIDGRPMEKGDDGIFRCPNGHTYDPNALPKSDPAIDATTGKFSGEI